MAHLDPARWHRLSALLDQALDLDPGGRAIPGFGISESLKGDQLRHAVRWTGGENLASLAGKPVSLRFALSRAELYSFAFRES